MEIITKILYATVGFIGGFVSGFIVGTLSLKIEQIRNLTHQGGWHFHHSALGLAALFLIPFLKGDINKIIFIVCFSAGIIIQHTIKEGFIFVTKD